MGFLKHQLTDVNRGDLAGELFQQPAAMVATFSHFAGDYPESPGPHECFSHWKAKTDGDRVMGVASVPYKLWRPYVTKSGRSYYCPACWHDRVLTFCQDIERLSLNYRRRDDLRYVAVKNGDVAKTQERIKKHNQRNQDRPILRFLFPLANETVFLHDAGDELGGDVLPADRHVLFALVETWAKTPKGKRAGRGLKLADRRPAATSAGDQDQDQVGQGDKPAANGCVMGGDYDTLRDLLREEFGVTSTKRGAKFDIDLAEFLAALGNWRIDYAYQVDGEPVPDKVLKDQDPNTLNGTEGHGTKKSEACGVPPPSEQLAFQAVFGEGGTR